MDIDDVYVDAATPGSDVSFQRTPNPSADFYFNGINYKLIRPSDEDATLEDEELTPLQVWADEAVSPLNDPRGEGPGNNGIGYAYVGDSFDFSHQIWTAAKLESPHPRTLEEVDSTRGNRIVATPIMTRSSTLAANTAAGLIQFTHPEMVYARGESYNSTTKTLLVKIGTPIQTTPPGAEEMEEMGVPPGEEAAAIDIWKRATFDGLRPDVGSRQVLAVESLNPHVIGGPRSASNATDAKMLLMSSITEHEVLVLPPEPTDYENFMVRVLVIGDSADQIGHAAFLNDIMGMAPDSQTIHVLPMGRAFTDASGNITLETFTARSIDGAPFAYVQEQYSSSDKPGSITTPKCRVASPSILIAFGMGGIPSSGPRGIHKMMTIVEKHHGLVKNEVGFHTTLSILSQSHLSDSGITFNT